jgi:hypothetical protein
MDYLTVVKDFIENQTEEFEEIDKEGNLQQKQAKKPF